MEPQTQYTAVADGMSIAAEMFVVPAGEFMMGNDGGRADERPAHGVSLPAFRAAVTPVTNAEYSRFVRATGAAPSSVAADARFNAAVQPVVGVS